MSGLGEFELIKAYFAPLAGPEGLELKDDAALYAPSPGHELVISKDMLAAGVHFFPNDDPFKLAQKALRVTLSDLAAKGAPPKGYTLGLGLPENVEASWLEAFSDGLAEDQKAYGLTLWGGDTIKTDQLVISLTGFGEVSAGKMARRGGAQEGDAVFVTGTIGDAALGLQLIKDKSAHYDTLTKAYHTPKPPIAASSIIAEHANGAMDVSDGLIADLQHMLAASNIGAEIDLDAIPVSAEAQQCIQRDPEMWPLIFGGDDYQILFTAPSAKTATLKDAFDKLSIQLTQIGVITKKGAGLICTRSGLAYAIDELKALSYTHF